MCAITGASAHECSQFMPMWPLLKATRVMLLSNHRDAPLPWKLKSTLSTKISEKHKICKQMAHVEVVHH